MPLSPIPDSRKRLHTRRISYDGWQREDGLFDIEARIVDTKDDDYVLASGVRPGGVPVHDMWARVTDRPPVRRPGGRDEHRRRAVSRRMRRHRAAYAKLAGANLMHGFRKALYDIVGGVHGCTHLTELIASLPTAASQTFATPSGRR